MKHRTGVIPVSAALPRRRRSHIGATFRSKLSQGRPFWRAFAPAAAGIAAFPSGRSSGAGPHCRS